MTSKTNKVHRQEFDIGDLVQITGPVGARGEVGLITNKKRMIDFPRVEDYAWHKDEYHCFIKLTTGEASWIRAKFLRIIHRAEKKH